MLPLNENHLSVLRVCLDFPHKDKAGTFAGEWIKDECERRGLPFHQRWLTLLANHGFLEKDDLVRGGRRRYYRVANAESTESLVSRR